MLSARMGGTATLNTEVGAENIVFYMASESEGFVLQVDASETDRTTLRVADFGDRTRPFFLSLRGRARMGCS